jgi:transcriptional regulator with XRE-family HTH domain
MIEVARRFGENLARVREQTGISQEEVGWRASLHRTEVSILERGARLPRIDTLVKLAGALDVSPCDLLDGIVWKVGTVERGGFGVSAVGAAEDKGASDG